MLFDSEPIDSRPTADDFPHRIWAEEEIPEAYRPFLTADRPFENMIFSPKPPYARDAHEYLLSWTEKDLLYLEKQRGQSIRSVQIVQEQVCAVLVSEDLLKGEYQIFSEGSSEPLRFRFNRSRNELYQAVLPVLLGVQPAKNGVRPQTLYTSEYALFNYSTAAFRLGEKIKPWQWWKIPRPLLRFGGRTKDGAALLCGMEHGSVVIQIQNTQVSTWYLLKGKASAVIEQAKDTQQLRIFGGQKEICRISRLKPEGAEDKTT